MSTARTRSGIWTAIVLIAAAAFLTCAPARAAGTPPALASATESSATDAAAGAPAHATLLDIARYFGPPTAKQRWISVLFGLTHASDLEVQQNLDKFVAALGSSNAGMNLSAPPVPTGDALFDRYALAVDAQIRTVKVKDISSLRAACLRDEQLAAWEREFGTDPRYWELRYMCAYSSYHEGHPKSEDANPRKYLEEARRRGIATANTLLLLYREERTMYENLLDQISQPRQWRGGAVEPPPDPSQDPVRGRYLRVSREAEQDERALLDAAVAKDPGCAWAYYERAMYWFDLGEQERGLADLEAGNAAPRNEYPLPFPFGVVARGLLAPAPAGSAAVSGAVRVESCAQSLFNFMPWKDHLKDSQVVVNLSGDTRPLEAWHQFSCRVAEGEPDRAITALTGIVLVDLVRSYMTDEQADLLDAAQQETLAHMLGASQVAKDAVKAGMPGWEMDAMLYFTIVGGARGPYCTYYISGEAECRTVARVGQVMRDLRQVHYPALQMPDCLRKYEALTKEEVQRRHDAERAKRRESESP